LDFRPPLPMRKENAYGRSRGTGTFVRPYRSEKLAFCPIQAGHVFVV
jgi:hypothetical protein